MGPICGGDAGSTNETFTRATKVTPEMLQKGYEEKAAEIRAACEALMEQGLDVFLLSEAQSEILTKELRKSFSEEAFIFYSSETREENIVVIRKSAKIATSDYSDLEAGELTGNNKNLSLLTINPAAQGALPFKILCVHFQNKMQVKQLEEVCCKIPGFMQQAPDGGYYFMVIGDVNRVKKIQTEFDEKVQTLGLVDVVTVEGFARGQYTSPLLGDTTNLGLYKKEIVGEKAKNPLRGFIEGYQGVGTALTAAMILQETVEQQPVAAVARVLPTVSHAGELSLDDTSSQAWYCITQTRDDAGHAVSTHSCVLVAVPIMIAAQALIG